jgi:hypothetical protein
MERPRMSIIAIDPGEEHNGVAVFVEGECRWTTTVSRDILFDSLGVWSALYCKKGMFDVVVVEEFKLYPGKAASLSWSTLGTVEIIGALRERYRREGITFVTQPASIKKPTKAMVKRRGLPIMGKDGHARDACMHGYYYLIHRGLEKEVGP